MSDTGAAELKRLRKIEQAARNIVIAIGPEECERAALLRYEFPGSGGPRFITNARLDDLVRALGRNRV